MRLYPLIILVLLNFLVISCDSGLQGSLNENLPPNTSLTLNEINMPEGKRLVSQVNISWWGDDPDGYIAGYEFFIGDPAERSEEDWQFTQKTDSVFILPIPEGNIEADVQFYVRAVDNDEARDPEPASLTFPIKNTAPSVSFPFNETPPDTTYRIFSFGIEADDPDGFENLNRIEIALNDTSDSGWKEIELDVSFITLRVDDTSEEPMASVMIGRSAIESEITFESINLDAENEFFVRTIDNAGAISNVISHTWFIKKQRSKVLFLNDYYGFFSQDRKELHLSLLQSAGIGQVDYMDISDGEVSGGTRVPLSTAFPHRSLAEPTINMMLAEWDYIYWISDDLDRNIGYALEITSRFFDEGGKMFVNIPIELLGDRNSIYQFLPFQGVENATYDEPNRSPQFRIRNCTEVNAFQSIRFDFSPELRFKENVFPTYPIIPFSESVPLFEADFSLLLANPRESADYSGNSVISVMNSEGNLIYFGIDIDQFTTPNTPETSRNNPCEDPDTGDTLPPSDLSGLIEFLTIETLGFEQ